MVIGRFIWTDKRACSRDTSNQFPTTKHHTHAHTCIQTHRLWCKQQVQGQGVRLGKGIGYRVVKYWIPLCEPECFPREGSSHSTPSQVPDVPSTVPVNNTLQR